MAALSFCLFVHFIIISISYFSSFIKKKKNPNEHIKTFHFKSILYFTPPQTQLNSGKDCLKIENFKLLHMVFLLTLCRLETITNSAFNPLKKIVWFNCSYLVMMIFFFASSLFDYDWNKSKHSKSNITLRMKMWKCLCEIWSCLLFDYGFDW